MRLLIFPKGVLGGQPIEMNATCVVVKDDQGVPVMVSGEYGPDGAIRSSHAADKDFNRSLQALGITKLVVCDRLVLPPPPPGARLVAGPEPIPES